MLSLIGIAVGVLVAFALFVLRTELSSGPTMLNPRSAPADHTVMAGGRLMRCTVEGSTPN